MANIQTVDYEKIPQQANQMRETGKALNEKIKKAYKQVGEMHTNWYGTRYNNLVKIFNEIIPSINEMLTVVVTQFPTALEQVAKNYAQADMSKTTIKVNDASISTIESIALSKDVGLRCVTSSVQSTQKMVERNFNDAIADMDKIQKQFSQITWQSEAASAFKSKFLKLKNEISKSFGDIIENFTKLMNQAIEDIDYAEKHNTVQ